MVKLEVKAASMTPLNKQKRASPLAKAALSHDRILSVTENSWTIEPIIGD